MARDYVLKGSGDKKTGSQYHLNFKGSPHYCRFASAYMQPAGTYEKRLASKKVRQYKGEIPEGSYYKKLWRPFEWS